VSFLKDSLLRLESKRICNPDSVQLGLDLRLRTFRMSNSSIIGPLRLPPHLPRSTPLPSSLSPCCKNMGLGLEVGPRDSEAFHLFRISAACTKVSGYSSVFFSGSRWKDWSVDRNIAFCRHVQRMQLQEIRLCISFLQLLDLGC
jgi:hypothetical protein